MTEPYVTPELFRARFTALADNVELAVRGKREVVELALVCLFAEGHLLIEDVPGVGKTTLARALGASLGATVSRIQFTPDLLPSDVVGVSIYHPAASTFQFHPGPVFANIVHGDEINRASPKTQSALLEVMEERRVTVDGQAHPVSRPFMVIATQNPVDMEGTYPLPEAQLDRFLMRVAIGYPDHGAEVEILAGVRAQAPVESLRPVISGEELARLVAVPHEIHVAAPLYDYIVDVVSATRSAAGVRLGASPRASVALLRAVRTRAAAAGRDYAVPADVKALARHVLAHRILLTSQHTRTGGRAGEVVDEVLASVPIPATVPAARGNGG